MSFPYRILNDLSAKLKAAEAQVYEVSKFYEAEITAIIEEYEIKLCNETLPIHPVSDQSQQIKPAADNLDIFNCKKEEDDEICRLKKKVSQLTYENNRYHLMLSNCTMCSDDHSLEDTSTIFDSYTQSLPTLMPFLSSAQAVESSTTPTLMPLLSSTQSVESSTTPTPCTADDTRWSTRMKRDKACIARLVKCLTKLEVKYSTPTHKRKERLFRRKKRTCAIVPKEFASIFDYLAEPDQEEVKLVPDASYPEVKWNLVKFKPVLPTPESCPIYSCSQDSDFYENYTDPDNGFIANKFIERHPFGCLPGFVTNLGVVAVPKAPVGGYVYCPHSERWLIHATTPTTSRRSESRGISSPCRRRGKG